MVLYNKDDRPRTFSDSFERLLTRVALAGALTVNIGGCALETAAPGEASSAVIGGNDADWAQREGQRNTDMVGYLNSYWQEYTDCGFRGGCQTVEVFVKVRVRRVEGADLDRKRVGIIYRAPNYLGATALGRYFTTLADGWEEWHVHFNLRTWQTGLFTFTAFYQDGKGHTYYDDNAGERHVIKLNTGANVIWRDYYTSTVKLTPEGVQGPIEVSLADLDYDKDVRLVWTVDDWRTINESPLTWVTDHGDDFERWRIDMDVPGNFQKFEYAIVYRHGVAGGAQRYEFWDNNWGRNYVVEREEQPIP